MATTPAASWDVASGPWVSVPSFHTTDFCLKNIIHIPLSPQTVVIILLLSCLFNSPYPFSWCELTKLHIPALHRKWWSVVWKKKCKARTEFQHRQVFSSCVHVSEFKLLLCTQCCATLPHLQLALELEYVFCSQEAHCGALCFVNYATKGHGSRRVYFSDRWH